MGDKTGKLSLTLKTCTWKLVALPISITLKNSGACTGEVLPDAGDAYICGESVLRSLAAARRKLGYCPQFSALPGALTGREVLRMYARLRGVPPSGVEAAVQTLLKRLDFIQYADR